MKCTLLFIGVATTIIGCLHPDSRTSSDHAFDKMRLNNTVILLTSFPWEYSGEGIDTTNNLNGWLFENEISDRVKKDIVFELEPNKKVKYWFKSDYIDNPVDTFVLADGNISISKELKRSNDLKIRKVYSGRGWNINPTDSTITIDFGKNDFGLLVLQGKYSMLSAGALCIYRSVDSCFSGINKKVNFVKCFKH